MGLDKLPEKPKLVSPAPISAPKPKKPKAPQTQSFVGWFQKNKQKVEEEYPDLEPKQRMKIAYSRFTEEINPKTSAKEVSDDETNKKRKLSDEQSDENNQPKRSASSKLAAFARDN